MGFVSADRQRQYQRDWLRDRRTAKGEEMRATVRARRKKLRARAIAYLGGVCVDCPATENLEFDHIVPRAVSGAPTIARTLSSKGWGGILEEVKKCELRCKPCHKAKR